MKILLVNDDGYRAEGINALDRVFEAAGHDIYVLAPETQQSGKSHSMKLLGTCKAECYGKNRYHISGSPADCIIYGLESRIFDFKPDLVISGINHGYNLSTDIVYSGTCAAARQASLYGFKAIAISEDSPSGSFSFERTARFLLEHFEHFIADLDDNCFLNINVPESFDGSYEYASIGEIIYKDTFSSKKENGVVYITNTGVSASFVNKNDSVWRNDFDVVSGGRASISFVANLPSVSESNMIRSRDGV